MKPETWGGTRREGWGGGRLVVLSLGALALAACHTTRPEPIIQTVEVKVPVVVPCKATVDVHDSYSDAKADQAPDIFEMVRQLLLGRSERDEDQLKLRAGVTGCGGTVK